MFHRNKEETITTKLVFRNTQLLLPSIEKRVQSAAGIRLLFIQAVHDVICSNYPLRPRHACRLAALALQANCGDYDPARFKKKSIVSEMAVHVPEHLRSSSDPVYWEQRIVEYYKKLHGLSSLAAMQKYLELCRQHPCYGSTFFPVTYIPPVTSLFKQQYDGDVLLAVNALGMHIVDASLAREVKGKPVKMCPFQRILSWDSDKLTFFCEYLPLHGPSELYTFKTPHGNLINDLFCDWLEEYRRCAQAIARHRAAQRGQA